MRLDPIAQKAGRYREPHQAFFYGFELHTSEPATEHILAKFSAQLILDPSPSLLIGACHIDAFFSFEKEPKRTRQNRRSRLREDATQLACWEMAGRADVNGRCDRCSRPQPLDAIPGW